MTVSSIVPVNNYTGNSSTTIFDFDFLIENESELVVQHINELGIVSILQNGVDYLISEVGNKKGSYITFPISSSKYDILAPKEYLSLSLNLQIKQESEFHNSSYFNLEILEWTFDYIVRILQILNRKVERCIKVEETAEVTPKQLIDDLYETRKEVQSFYSNIVDLSNQVKTNLDNTIAEAQLVSEHVQLVKNEVDVAKQEAEKAKNQAEIATQKAKDAVSMPVGSIVALASTSEYVPDGYLLADGTEYSKIQFPDLWNEFLMGNNISIVEEDWQTATSSYSHQQYNCITYGNGYYVAVGKDGKMSTSTDGLIWQNSFTPSGIQSTKLDIAFGNGTFVTTCSGIGYFLRCTKDPSDKSNWSNVILQTNVDWTHIKFGNNKFVAICNSKVAVSNDNMGETFTEYPFNNAKLLEYGNGLFVIVSTDGAVSTSVDGITWSKTATLQTIEKIAFDDVNKRFIVIATSGEVLTSDDCVTWTQIGTVPTSTYTYFAIGGGKGVVFSSSENTAYETSDYQTWKSVKVYDSTSTSFKYVFDYCNDKFLALRSGSAETYYKVCSAEVVPYLNTCTYAEYETELATYGQCAKFGLDVDNGTFRIPFLPQPKRYLIDKKEPTDGDPTWYNLYSDGWLEQGGIGVGGNSDTGNYQAFVKSYRNSNVIISAIVDRSDRGDLENGASNTIKIVNVSADGFYQSTCYAGSATGKFESYPFRWSACGYCDTVVEEVLKYFVVVANGQTNQSMMDWSEWASSLQGKLNVDHSNDKIPYIVESFVDGTSGYKLWSDGYCEQWGVVGINSTSGYPKITIELLKSYNDTNFNVQVTGRYNSTASASSCFCYERTASSISIIGIGYGCDWVTKGYMN